MRRIGRIARDSSREGVFTSGEHEASGRRSWWYRTLKRVHRDRFFAEIVAQQAGRRNDLQARVLLPGVQGYLECVARVRSGRILGRLGYNSKICCINASQRLLS